MKNVPDSTLFFNTQQQSTVTVSLTHLKSLYCSVERVYHR